MIRDNNSFMCELFQSHPQADGASAPVVTLPDKRRLLGPVLLLSALLLCLFQMPAVVFAEEDYEAGRTAYQQNDYAEAERIWRRLAEQGEVRSQFFLGVLYDQGPESVGKDDVKATQWFEKAASQGHLNAQFNLGNAYMNGRGVEQSHERAVYWWRQAADNGSPNAQFNLAIQYYQGHGVEKDWDKAVLYFNRAANNGHAKAQELIASNQVPQLEEVNAEARPEAAAVTEVEPLSPPSTASTESAAASADSDSAELQAPATEPASTTGTAEQWLSKQNPSHYTVQLAVSGNAEGIERLVSRHNLSNATVRVPVTRDGKTFYYLLMGSFVERHQASSHIESLAADLRASKPWPRPFADLQSLVDYDG